MKVELGYRKEKIADICADFGVAFSYKGSYPLKNNPGYWIWFPHFEKGHKSDYINQFSEDKSRIIVTPANENASANMEKAFDDRIGKKFIAFPKLDDGFYTFSGVYEFSKKESTSEKEVYVKIADSYSDEPEKSNKMLFVILAVVALLLALLGLKFCGTEEKTVTAEPAPARDTVMMEKVVEVVKYVEKIQTDFNNANFEKGKDELNPDTKAVLTVLASQLNKFPDAKLKIVGHASQEGTDEFNQNISEKRAKACVDFLISEGVSSDRLSFEGKGSSEPIDANDLTKNRRTEFIVIE